MATLSVDISIFTTSSSIENFQERREAAKALIDSLVSNGYVGIRGHGLPPEFFRSIFSQAKRFFALPPARKIEASHRASAGAPPRGFTPAGIEHAAKSLETKEGGSSQGVTAADYKETFDVTSSSTEVEHPNVWLPEPTLPGFRSFMVDAYSQLHLLCHTILDALMLGMGLTESECASIKDFHPGLRNQLRLNHYLPFPKQMLESDEKTRLGAHMDWSTFTLVFQDIYPGLEFEDRASGGFILAPLEEGLLYLNVGHMLERLSNGLLPASLHRVVVPDTLKDAFRGSETIPSRFSIPYFFSPRPDEPIAPQETRVKEDGSTKYEPVTPRVFSERAFIAARAEDGPKN
ncbi:MAG: hypothetical protein M1820_005495 [Bogoriella megaspora]|nr:MAG: hypothetical protein M1820_005495 [Bogoriella megaspora]